MIALQRNRIRSIDEVLLGPTEVDEMFSENQQDMIALATAEAMQLPGVTSAADALTHICADWLTFRKHLKPQVNEIIRAVLSNNPTAKTARAIVIVEAFLEV
jgi:predicted nucleic acid-binding Zn ribbon protein